MWAGLRAPTASRCAGPTSPTSASTCSPRRDCLPPWPTASSASRPATVSAARHRHRSGVRVIAIQARQPAGMHHCSDAGFETIVSIPILQHDRLMGEVDLFFHNQFSLSAAERSLLEALTAHLAGAMENLRLNALEKEAAVSQERTFLARELHDSIAQSLAFLKIQVHLMRDALADRRSRAGGAGAGRDRRRRARMLRRRARTARAFPHARQRRGHRARAA